MGESIAQLGGGLEVLDGEEGVVVADVADPGAVELAGQPLVGGRAGARCQPLDWSFPRPAPPNRTCVFPRIRLSTGRAAGQATSGSVSLVQGLGMRFAR